MNMEDDFNERIQQIKTFWHNAQRDLADYWQRCIILEMLLLFIGKTRSGSEKVKILGYQTAYFLYRHWQHILFFCALLLFYELEQKRTRTFIAFWYKTKTYLDDRCQWGFQMFLKLTKKGAEKMNTIWDMTMKIFSAALHLFIELFKKLIHVVKSFVMTSYNKFIANPWNFIFCILLMVLIVLMGIMNYQLFLERSQLLEDRRLYLEERRQLIDQRNQLMSESWRLRRIIQESDEPSSNFVYFAKKAANILELAVPFVKYFW
ncbi:uncharacterized protein [Aquarana catesbeiana]|uniref:uncharacterized protein isoform X3 n=1 Tax=Aquarana catesbeiana TaxID=8400 RepID=UPI003CC9F338